jgi:hypothetical protein
MNCFSIAQCILNIQEFKVILDKEANSESMTSDEYIRKFASKRKLYGTIIDIQDKSIYIQQPNGRKWYSELTSTNKFILNDKVRFKANHKKTYITVDTHTIFYASKIRH